MIHIHSMPSQFLLPSPLKQKYIKPPNEAVMYVCVQIWHHLQIYTINWNGNTQYTYYICICVRWMNLHFSWLYKYFTCNLNILHICSCSFLPFPRRKRRGKGRGMGKENKYFCLCEINPVFAPTLISNTYSKQLIKVQNNFFFFFLLLFFNVFPQSMNLKNKSLMWKYCLI